MCIDRGINGEGITYNQKLDDLIGWSFLSNLRKCTDEVLLFYQVANYNDENLDVGILKEMSEIISFAIKDLVKGDEINTVLLDDLYAIIRHKFYRSIKSDDDMLFKLFKIYYAFYHQH